jgi:hypothetical protein
MSVDHATGLSATDSLTTRQMNVQPMMFTAYPKSERYIAVSHRLEVMSEESNLSQVWEAVVKFCGTIRCEIVSSSITTRTKELTPSAAIMLRVFPED